MIKTKVCSRCKEKKPLTSEFYTRRNNRSSGFRSDCKVCRSTWRRNDRHLHPEKYKEQDIRSNAIKTTEQRRIDNLRYKKKNRKKISAQGKVYYYKRKGKLVPLPCEICGEKKVHAHHRDYNKPLDVMWLCHKHHEEWHFNNTSIS